MLRRGPLCVLSLFVSALVWAGCNSDTCIDNNSCYTPPPDGGDASPGDAGGDAPVDAPPGCDASADPKDAPKCVVNDFGVFADATNGADGNAGTKESPVKSITAALGKLAGKSRVYVAAGTYAEHVTLTSAVSLYGGFAGGTWSYTGDKANVAPSDAGYALAASGVSSPVVLADVSLTAQGGTTASPSSIAVFLANASVTFRRAALTAGKASDGVSAVDPGAFSPLNAPDGTGGVAGGAATPNPACTTSIGGAGGKDGATSGQAGVVAVAAAYPTGYIGQANGNGCTAGVAANGSYGVAGTSGAGAATLGTLTADGWAPTDGAPGGKGGDGQGGGGGAQISATGVGGSGGPGGCGGAAGLKGTGGGSSIALASFQSTVTLVQTTLVAADAGRGGNGAKGQVGQLGSMNPGSPNNFGKACIGGIGGIGGSGGGGGGGAGGVSAGILYKGTPPSIDGAPTPAADTLQTVTLGALGAAGQKGTGGAAADPGDPPSRAGADGTNGAPGQAKAVLAAP